ncbi:hypothetical protein ACS5NO_20850 [Larkinella sp. GY13]|uniref:hypothetical protein n=1 Tax=Larkinella sp. GY13 TaxID=3453720 RepID=UPI003EF00C5D
MKWIIKVIRFVQLDRKRFLWELVVGGLVWAVGFALSWLTSQSSLQTCQDERTALLRENSRRQALFDSIQYAGQLAQGQQIISTQQQRIHDLQEKMVRDSLQHLSELDALRAIVDYVTPKNTVAPRSGSRRQR